MHEAKDQYAARALHKPPKWIHSQQNGCLQYRTVAGKWEILGPNSDRTVAWLGLRRKTNK
eukprot:3197917-Amphidinium_carterae.1